MSAAAEAASKALEDSPSVSKGDLETGGGELTTPPNVQPFGSPNSSVDLIISSQQVCGITPLMGGLGGIPTKRYEEGENEGLTGGYKGNHGILLGSTGKPHLPIIIKEEPKSPGAEFGAEYRPDPLPVIQEQPSPKTEDMIQSSEDEDDKQVNKSMPKSHKEFEVFQMK